MIALTLVLVQPNSPEHIARENGWTHGGDSGGFWFHGPTWGWDWKAAASWSGDKLEYEHTCLPAEEACPATYDTPAEIIEAEGLKGSQWAEAFGEART